MAGPVNAPRAVSDPQDKEAEVVEAVREVRDSLAKAIDRSVERRPYTTLLLAVGLGFLLGATWAR
jgi:ElaB/YqjD/DUF883 family membrane-anchored ribosome-binding protein